MSKVKREMSNPFLLLSIVLWCVALSGAPVRGGGVADGVKHGEYRTFHDNGHFVKHWIALLEAEAEKRG